MERRWGGKIFLRLHDRALGKVHGARSRRVADDETGRGRLARRPNPPEGSGSAPGYPKAVKLLVAGLGPRRADRHIVHAGFGRSQDRKSTRLNSSHLGI